MIRRVMPASSAAPRPGKDVARTEGFVQPSGQRATQRESRPAEPGLTARSIPIALLVILLSAIVVQFAGVFDNANPLIGTEALPIPAMLVFWPIAAALAGVGAVARTRLLTKPELICVLFAALVATPLLSVGFWRYQLSGLSTVVRASDWTKFEALPEGLWPHGANLFENVLDSPGLVQPRPAPAGAVKVAAGVATLTNSDPAATSAVRIQVRLGPDTVAAAPGRTVVAVPGRPYLLTALVRATDLGSGASYRARLYADDKESYAMEPISARSEARATPLLADGFVRVGSYPLMLPKEAAKSVTFELALNGEGKAEFRDLRLYDVRAIESAYSGMKRVTEAEYARLSLAERQSVIVVPDSLFSRAGLRYAFGLDYPISDWVSPIVRLAAFMLLIYGAVFGLILLYRKQWLESERYPLPMARVLLVLLGADESKGGLGQHFLRNRWLWIGFSLSFGWCALKVLHGFIPSLPDLRISFSVKSYLADAFWGRTWDGVQFEVLALFLGLGLFMELNILLSLVLGFLAFRLQHWFGQAQGLSSDTDFPYYPQQMLGAYLVYAFLVIAFTRRYLGGAVRAVVDPSKRADEVVFWRAGVALIALSFGGLAAWAVWNGITVVGALLIGSVVMLLAWVAAKFRAECGLPAAGFNHPLGSPGNFNVPVEAMILVPLLGGMAFFGGSSVLTMSLITAVLLPFGFFIVPGMWVEALEVGRRFRLKSSHAALAALLGVVAAVVIGGWVYLSSAYGFGASNFAEANDFSDRSGAFRVFNAEYAREQSALDSKTPAPSPWTSNPSQLFALGFGGLAAAVVTGLRQLFPGFWFHPIGLLVGPSSLMETAWASLFAAYVVRLSVLKLGGAATVREKLIPIAVGIFLGALLGYALFVFGNAYWFLFSKGNVKFRGLL